MKKILTVGGATNDIYLHYEGADVMKIMEKGGHRSYMLFESGAKVEVEKVLYHTGGGATNSAVSFNRLGFETSCFCMIGDDQAGKSVLRDLERENINTKSIVRSKEYATGTSFVINSLRNERTIFAYRGANGFILPKDIPVDAIKMIDQLYITSLSNESTKNLKQIVSIAKEHNVSVAINPGISQLAHGTAILKDALRYIDILILNSSEAKTFMQALIATDMHYQKVFEDTGNKASLLCTPFLGKNICFSLPNFFKEVMNMGSTCVVVTDGARGVYVATKEVIYFHPSLSVDVVDTLGAGDAFGSCFVGSLALGLSVEKALQFGVINSASVIEHIGAKPGLLSLQEIEKRAKKIQNNMVQQYEL